MRPQSLRLLLRELEGIPWSETLRIPLDLFVQTLRLHPEHGGQIGVEDHALGFYQALVEGRVPFDMAHDLLLDPAHIGRYRTLILPNIAALSDEQCRQLAAFVEGGGNLIATHETSLYDEWGKRRGDFGLASLFGASYAGRVDADVHNSYLNVDRDPKTGQFHPLVRGLEDATRIINGTHWVHVKPHSKAHDAPLTLVPSYPDLPMEQVWPRVPRTDTPGVIARQAGRGRVVYFPFDLDRTFWEVLSADHAKVLQNARCAKSSLYQGKSYASACRKGAASAGRISSSAAGRRSGGRRAAS